ncbi:hypothetical protein KDW20_12010 [Burkholderia cenocepacia]|uniref:hypothetical protein n=1 Tax=Burkholderia cenocepacia TaxID=95486 RepID=UPI001B8F8D31|nr:hypothetical protein [Burkholderia cenocepacia]MBR8376502.1 hypothetical protein [Burkholderia cenocepacia]
MSEQFSLFEGISAFSLRRGDLPEIRPANMRTSHGLHGPKYRYGYSVSSVQCVEETLADNHDVRVSGGGMDAPEDIPTGSVKACFWDRQLTGLIQRTMSREKR